MNLWSSVADPYPDPDPPDPHVFGPSGFTRRQCCGSGSESGSGSTCFGPSGSGSTSQRYGSGSGSCAGSGSFYHHAKIVRKTLIPTILLLFLTFFSLKNDVNVASKSNKQKKLNKKISFLLASWRFMTKIAGSGSRIRIRIRDPLVRLRSMDPRIRIRIHPKMSWIRNTARRYGSGSGSGSGSFYHCKNSKKNLDSYYFVTLLDFLSLKNDVNVPSKSNKQKKMC